MISRTQQVMKLLSEIKRLQRVARCMTLSYQCFTCEVFDFAHRGSCFKVWNAVRYILYFWIQLESYSDIWLVSEAIIPREPHQISSQMDMARAMVKRSLADEFRIDRRQEARQAQPERSRSHSWNHPWLAIDSSQFWTCMHIKKQDTGSRSRKEATERWRDATDCSRRTLWRGRPNWLGTSVAKGMHGLSSNISLPIGHSIYFADERWIPRSRLARWGCAGGSFGIAAVSFHFVKWCPRQWLLRNCNARRVMWMCLKITELCEGNSTVFFFCEKSPPRNCPTYPKKTAQ